MHESEKWKWSRSVVSNSSQPHGLQTTRLLHPWDFPGKSTGVGCHCQNLSFVLIGVNYKHKRSDCQSTHLGQVSNPSSAGQLQPWRGRKKRLRRKPSLPCSKPNFATQLSASVSSSAKWPWDKTYIQGMLRISLLFLNTWNSAWHVAKLYVFKFFWFWNSLLITLFFNRRHRFMADWKSTQLIDWFHWFELHQGQVSWQFHQGLAEACV